MASTATNQPEPLTLPDFWAYKRTHHGQRMTMLYYVRLEDGRWAWVNEREYRQLTGGKAA